MNYFNKIKVNNHSQTWFQTANVSVKHLFKVVPLLLKSIEKTLTAHV